MPYVPLAYTVISNYLCYTLTWMHTTHYTIKNSGYQQLLASADSFL